MLNKVNWSLSDQEAGHPAVELRGEDLVEEEVENEDEDKYGDEDEYKYKDEDEDRCIMMNRREYEDEDR